MPGPNAWVLWRRYSDGSDRGTIVRVYLDKARGEEDFAMVKDGAYHDYFLDEVPIYGTLPGGEPLV